MENENLIIKDNLTIRIVVVGLGNIGKTILKKLCQENKSVGTLIITGYDIKPIAWDKDMYEMDFTYTTDSKILSKSDVIIICVPTSAHRKGKIIVEKLNTVFDVLSKIDLNESSPLIIIESTLPIGSMARIVKHLEGDRNVLGSDFYLAYCPERYDNEKWTEPNDLPRLIGVYDEDSYKGVQSIYENIFHCVTFLTTPEIAEVAKLYENYTRYASIQMANMFADMCIEKDINPIEALSLAQTKPNVPNVFPGFIGGHCLPDNALMLEKHMNYDCVRKINSMDMNRLKRIVETLRARDTEKNPQNIMILGIGYKLGNSDNVFSGGKWLIDNLKLKFGNISVYDVSNNTIFVNTISVNVIIVFHSSLAYFKIIDKNLEDRGLLLDFTGSYSSLADRYEYGFP